MSFIVRLLIGIYRVCVPRQLKPVCIFRDNCSAHVLEGANAGGLREALRRLRRRIQTCRPGYRLMRLGDGTPLVLLADGSAISLEEVSSTVRSELTA